MAPPAGIPATAVEIVSASVTPQMLNALANDQGFRIRFTGLLEAIAAQILNTAVGTGSPVVTAGQQAYARTTVLANPAQAAATLILYLVHRTNITGANLWVDLSTGIPAVFTDATDAAILSQLANDWAQISGA